MKNLLSVLVLTTGAGVFADDTVRATRPRIHRFDAGPTTKAAQKAAIVAAQKASAETAQKAAAEAESAEAAYVVAAHATAPRGSEDVETWVIIIMVVVSLTVVLLVSNRVLTASRRALVVSAVEETKALAASINERHLLPVVANPAITLHTKEFAVLQEHSTLYEYRSERVTTGIGTRMGVGSLPVYLGQSRSVSEDKLRMVASGILTLTNQRFVFAGNTETLSVPLNRILRLENQVKFITLSFEKRHKPAMFAVKNGVTWALLVKTLTQVQLDSPEFTGTIAMNIT
jgi:hypothetical protein